MFTRKPNSQGKEADSCNLPLLSWISYSNWCPFLLRPHFQTFLQIITGWILSQRHRYVTDIIFSRDNIDNGQGGTQAQLGQRDMCL